MRVGASTSEKASSAEPPTTSNVLLADGLAKSYGGHVVLNHVRFGVGRGEILAVIGENGAGKSTFAKIVAGVVQPDAGSLVLNGSRVDFQSPRDALRVGISYIPQELAYLSNLTAADNILIGRWPSRRGITSKVETKRTAARAAAGFGIDINVSRLMAELTLAERQLVEIVKALTRESEVLVLDEPTASLTSAESANLFKILRELVRTGLGVLFISHRMDEIFAVSDRVVVLRNGEVVAETPTAATTHSELIKHMLGSAAEELTHQRDPSPVGAPALQLVDWSWSGHPPIRDFNLNVHGGEITCLFGLRGCGGEVIAESLTGRDPLFSGRTIVEGKAYGIFRTPRSATRAGISYVPAERKRDGLVMTLSVQANVSLLSIDHIARLGWLRTSRERRLAARMRDRLRIRMRSLTQLVSTLSGGNQQKVVLASRLVTNPRVLVLQEPTRGVDVGARVEIHQYLRAIADQGTAVLWITTDVEEAVVVADRLVVLREGAIVGELTGEMKTQGSALAMATKDAA